MIECFFDCSSPWTYLAFHNLQPLAQRLGVEVAWRPILVGGVFNQVNPSIYELRAAPVPAKDRYMRKDLNDWARAAGLQLSFPPDVFPVNSVKAMRGCVWLAPQGKLIAFATKVFEAYSRDNLDISQDEILAEICARANVDVEAFQAGIASPQVKDQLRINTEELIARGGFGSPTLFVDRDDMYFGNDRLALVAAAVEARQARAQIAG